MSENQSLLVNEPEEDGETALIAAALSGNQVIVKLLLAADADVDARRGDGVTALTAAASQGHLESVRLILDKIRSLEAAGHRAGDLDQQVAMSIVVSAAKGHISIVEALIEHCGSKKILELFPAIDREIYEDLSVSGLVERLVPQIKASIAATFPINSLPDHFPSEDDETLPRWPCVVIPTAASTFAGLPLHPASQECIGTFERLMPQLDIEKLDNFTTVGLRASNLPFLADSKLVLMPHCEGEFGVPFIMSADKIVLLRRENEVLYELLQTRKPGWTDEELISLTLLFFSSVVGRLGAFNLVEGIEQIRWNSGATQGDREIVRPHLFPIKILDRSPGGRHRLRASVLFKNGLFHTDILALDDPSKNTDDVSPFELVNETLILEDLPIDFGMHVDLVVRR